MISKGGDFKACAAANGQNLSWQHIAKFEAPELVGAELPQDIV
jgi:hypothetical protein